VALFQCYFVNQKIDRAYFVPVNGDFSFVTSYILDIKDKIVDFPEPVFPKMARVSPFTVKEMFCNAVIFVSS
jgi:hypothetical protein